MINNLANDEAASAPRDRIAEWLLECPATHHVILSTTLKVSSIEKAAIQLDKWALRQAKALKAQLAYRGIITDAGVSKRIHVHLLLWGKDRQGVSLLDNRRFDMRFEERNPQLWPGNIKAVEIDDLKGLVRYMTVNNYSEDMFHPVFGQTSKKLLLEV